MEHEQKLTEMVFKRVQALGPTTTAVMDSMDAIAQILM